jgi:type I restriction enzyme M protein
MNKTNSDSLSQSIVNSLISFRGQFSINELEEILLSFVFLRFIREESLKNGLFNFDNSNDIFDNLISRFDIEPNIGESLNRLFHNIEKYNPELEGIFSDIDFNSKSSSKEFNRVLSNMYRLVSDIDFREVDFGDFFNDLLNSIISSKGKREGEFSSQPKELTELMLSFIPKKDLVSIYNPFSGYASLGINLPIDSSYLGQELNRKVWAFSKLRLMINKVKNSFEIYNVNVFDSWANDESASRNGGFISLSTNASKFDFIVSTPPFNLKLPYYEQNFKTSSNYFSPNNANSYIIHECFKRLKSDGGKAVLALSNSFLFSENILEKKLKEFLIQNHFVEMVISLPSGILNYTSIPFNLLILSNTTNKVLPTFIDASNCFIEISKSSKILDLEKIYSILSSENSFKRQVQINEIAQNDFSLIPARYLNQIARLELEPGYKLVKLGDLVSSIPKIKAETDVNIKYLRIRDLSDNILSYAKTFDDLEETSLSDSSVKTASLLAKESLLVSLRWKTLKPTFYTSSNASVFYPSNDILALKVNEKLVDLDYLILELEKEYVLRQIENERKGATIPYISKEKLLSIQIKVPSLVEQQKTDVKIVKEALIKSKLKELGLEEQFSQLKKEQLEDLSLKKHNIMQHLNNVQSSIDSLSIFMKTNDGILDAKSIIYPKLGTTVQKRFELLSESLKEAIYFVDNITNELNFQKAEYLNVSEVINLCIEKGIQNDQLFEISFFIDEDSFINEEETIVPMIKFSKSDFEELYNNILQNAIVHGFSDNSRKYKLAIELKFDQELNKIVISFSNNGKPFPKGMAERYQIKGEKAGSTGNKGIGSWKVYEIAKHFGAEIIAQDLAGEEFPVRIDLLLNIENE